MEILYPDNVRNEMKKITNGMRDEYKGVSRSSCKLKVPSVEELLKM